MKPALATRQSRLTPLAGSALQCILGGLLGDACLDARPTNPRVTFNHGQPQEAYTRHKASVLKDYVLTAPTLVPNAGYGSVLCRFRTVTTPAFDFLRALCLQQVDGRLRKTVTAEWLALLDWEGAAYWFMDDGCLTAKSAQISTHSFSHEEVTLLAGWFCARDVEAIVYPVKTNSGRSCWILRFNKNATTRLITNIAPFVPECMAYKAVAPAAARPVACCICGKLRSGKGPSGGRAPLCGDPKCANARNAQTRYLRLGRTGKQCGHCQAPLVDMGSKRLCDGCRTRERVRQIKKKRSAYTPKPPTILKCAWCETMFRKSNGGSPARPCCKARDCLVHARRYRRDHGYTKKPLTYYRVSEEEFNRRARSKEVA